MAETAAFTLPSFGPAAEEEGAFEQKLDYVDESPDFLIEYFRQGPRNRAVLEVFAAQCQELEDAIWDMVLAFDVDTATGDQLDILGRILKVPKSYWMTDDDYRAAIRTTGLIYRSSGTHADLVAVSLALVPAATVWVRDTGTATVGVDLSTTGGLTLKTIITSLTRAKAGGVRLTLAFGLGAVGAVDGDPLGGTIGAVDGDPEGFEIGGAASA